MSKSKHNSYFLFMQDQKKKNLAWKDKSNQELMVLCDPLWQKLSPHEKMKYELMKSNLRGKNPMKIEQERKAGEVRVSGGYDSLGRSLVSIGKRDRERKMEQINTIDNVTEIIDTASLTGSFTEFKFYIIETNSFAKTEENPPKYVPAELSIGKFSLKDGVIDVYQAFPAPGKIPRGYKRLCVESSRDGHKIPLEVGDAPAREPRGDDDDEVIFKHTEDKKLFLEISDFLGGTNLNVFTMPEHIAQCKGIIRTIADRSNLPSLDLNILPLPQLFVRLANKSEEGTILPNANVAEIELERERFLYQAGVNCPWHEAMTDTINCSSATVWRWCFTVLDRCCQHYKISLVPGKHIPKGLDTAKFVVKEWELNTGKIGVNGSSSQGKSIVNRPGEFISKDIRFKENLVKDCRVQPQDIAPEEENLQENGVKAKLAMDKELYETEAGTISDYIGKMSVVSDSSSDSEFVALDSISQVMAKQDDKIEEQPTVVERRYGAGRGCLLPSRQSRIAANFPGRK